MFETIARRQSLSDSAMHLAARSAGVSAWDKEKSTEVKLWRRAVKLIKVSFVASGTKLNSNRLI